MKYFYLTTLDKYVSPTGDLYTDSEIDYLNILEHEWKNSLPRLHFHELMTIFPEAVKPARRGLKLKLKYYKEAISDLDSRQEEYYNNVISKAHFKIQNLLKEISDESHSKLRSSYEKKIKSITYQLSYLDELEGKGKTKTVGGVDEGDIERAKEVPITNFYTDKLHTHGKRAKGRCPFHNENNDSFTIYLDQNSFYCYGCNAGGSVVDFVMQQRGVDFLSAVKLILK